MAVDSRIGGTVIMTSVTEVVGGVQTGRTITITARIRRAQRASRKALGDI